MMIIIDDDNNNNNNNNNYYYYYHYYTVKPLFTDILLIQTPLYYGQLSLPLGKVHTFPVNSTRLIRTTTG